MCHRKALFALGLSCLTGGLIMFCMFGWMFIPPYIYTRNFQQTTCKVHTSYFSGNVCCSLDATGQCDVWYGCWQVVVNYTNPSTVQGYLFRDFMSATQQKTNSCTLYTGCVESSYSEVSSQLPSFTSSYGQINQEYGCFYNPTKATEVLVYRTDLQVVIHSCLWSFILCIAGIVITVLTGKNIGNCYINDEEDEKPLQEAKEVEPSPVNESSDRLSVTNQLKAEVYTRDSSAADLNIKPRTPLSPNSSTPLFLEENNGSDPRGGLSEKASTSA